MATPLTNRRTTIHPCCSTSPPPPSRAGPHSTNAAARTPTVAATGCYPNDPVLIAVGTVQLSLPLLLSASNGLRIQLTP